MRPSRLAAEQIRGLVREAQAGAKEVGVCRRHRISEHTTQRWRAAGIARTAGWS